jgi:hypothetical protein
VSRKGDEAGTDESDLVSACSIGNAEGGAGAGIVRAAQDVLGSLTVLKVIGQDVHLPVSLECHMHGSGVGRELDDAYARTSVVGEMLRGVQRDENMVGGRPKRYAV